MHECAGAYERASIVSSDNLWLLCGYLIAGRIDYLATKAGILVKEAISSKSKRLNTLYDKLLFSEEEWEATISPFLREIKNPSLAISNPLSGCIFLVENEPSEGTTTTWNAEGYSTILRMSLFVMKFIEALRNTGEIIVIGAERGSRLLRWIMVVQELVKDNLNIAGTNDIWKNHSPEVDAEIIEFTSSIQRLILSIMDSSSGQHYFAAAVTLPLLERCGNTSVEAFYSARALAKAYADLCEAHQIFKERYVRDVDKDDMWKSTGNFVPCSLAGDLLTAADIFRSAALLVGTAGTLPQMERERVWMGMIGTLLGVSSANAATSGKDTSAQYRTNC
jgi:hypothetical protein